MEIEPEAAADVVKRLRRVQGQLGGIIAMLEDGRDCADVVTQVAAASRALDRAGFKLVASGLRECMAAAERGEDSALDTEQLEKLFLSLA